jgi:hypothetical protein
MRLQKYKEIIENTPLEFRIQVSNEMAFIELLTVLGLRKDSSWVPEEGELLEKLLKFAREHTADQMGEIQSYIDKLWMEKQMSHEIDKDNPC